MGLDIPPYKPAVTSLRMAERLSRAITLLPILAWIASSNNWRGKTSSVWFKDSDKLGVILREHATY